MTQVARQILRTRLLWAAVILAGLGVGGLHAVAQEASEATVPEGGSLVRWPQFQPVRLPSEAPAGPVDFLLTPSVFDKAAHSLQDLRLSAGAGDIPYALRVREPRESREKVAAKIYNRTQGPDQSTEAWLDLNQEGLEHNEIEIDMQGDNFRRRVVLEGSTDADHWRQLKEGPLFRLESSHGPEADLNLSYPVSRFRYLRVRVYEDPTVDQEPVKITAVSVYRTVQVPGEKLTLDAAVGPREAVRGHGAPASAWILDLGGANVPCSELEVDFGDASFARDYYLEAAGPVDSEQRFSRIPTSQTEVWRRVAGETGPLLAKFSEIRAARLRLVVVDHENPPLELRGAKFRAAAREVIFVPPAEHPEAVRLYYGNPEAPAPNYDYARNLPAQLSPPPLRATLGPPEPNPTYVPKPLPLTERWPWLIYLVLGGVSLVLAGVIVQVARQAIALHDADATEQ